MNLGLLEEKENIKINYFKVLQNEKLISLFSLHS